MVPLSHGQAPGVLAGGRLTGRWRYDRTLGRGIALSYDRGARRSLIPRRPGSPAGGRFAGRWRYNPVVGHGITLSYDRSVSKPPAPAWADPEPITPALMHSPMVRVLCSCGELFTFERDAGVCPRCCRLAEWPTMGQVEREMRCDLEELLREH